MEAIIRDSGRQFKVREGMTIDVDYRDLAPGSPIEFAEVLYLDDTATSEAGSPGTGSADTGSADTGADAGSAGEGGSSGCRIGNPRVEGAKVVGKVVGTVKGPKLRILQFRRRKNSRRRIGHRQRYTQVHIESIQAS